MNKISLASPLFCTTYPKQSTCSLIMFLYALKLAQRLPIIARFNYGRLDFDEALQLCLLFYRSDNTNFKREKPNTLAFLLLFSFFFFCPPSCMFIFPEISPSIELFSCIDISGDMFLYVYVSLLIFCSFQSLDWRVWRDGALLSSSHLQLGECRPMISSTGVSHVAFSLLSRVVLCLLGKTDMD